MIKLGDKVRDRVTGLVGIAVAKVEWLYGCDRITIQPQELKDGKPADMQTFDELQLEVVETQVVLPDSRPKNGRTGGPQNDAAALRR